MPGLTRIRRGINMALRDMVLAKINDDAELHEMEKTLWGIGWGIGSEYDIMISLLVKDFDHFYEWIDAIAYYQNIVKDGVVLYGT